MNDNKHHIKQYSAADIQRYLKGELSAAEMHAMERAALDDPFLADAIEGMEQTIEAYGGDVINNDLRKLKVALEEKAGSDTRPLARVRFIRWWKPAAAALILITGGALAYNSFFATDNDRALAVHHQEKAAPVPATVPVQEEAPLALIHTDSIVSADMVPPALATAKQEAKKKLSPAAQKEVQPAIAEISTNQRLEATDSVQHFSARKLSVTQSNVEQAKTANASAPEKKDLRNKEEGADDKAATEVVRVPETDAIRQRAFNNANSQDPALHNIIKGRVTDQFNRPLSNAFLTNEQTRMNFTTDRNGLFNIPAKDSTIDVSISANGFATQRIQLQNNNPASNQIQLQPAIGYGSGSVLSAYEKKSNPKTGTAGNGYRSIMVQDAEPVYGWVGYEQYLDKNKRVPQNTPDLHGDVVVTFIVNKKGELSAFKIAQSLSAAHDAEAIRLIKAGPSWKLLKGRRAKTTVIIQF